MAFTHAGFSIPGTHEEVQYGEWAYAAQYNRVFGLNGASVLDGGRATRPIEVPSMWIHNSYAGYNACFTALGNLEARIGRVGALVELGNISKTIPNVLFLGLKLEQGPIPPTSLGWFAVVTLHFLQLGPE